MNLTEKIGLFSSEEILRLRSDFPILSRSINGKPLIYFDNGATTQKPRAVIDSLVDYYSHHNANIHRGVHTLSQEASAAYEEARSIVAQHLNASADEIIFTRGTTESINLVAQSFVRNLLNEGDEVLITAMEHHSNIVPWQLICEEKKAKLVVVPINDRGELVEGAFEKLLSPKTRIAAFTHVSNTLGTVNPVKEMTQLAHSKNIPVIIDGAQAIPHTAVDVKNIDADFYVFSGHKVYGPTGIGILYAKADRLEQLQPYQGGGGIIKTVTFEKTTYVSGPLKFEAGTPHIEGAIGLGAAFNYVNAIGMNRIADHEQTLLHHATGLLRSINGIRIIGEAQQKAGVISFVAENIPALDLGMALDALGIAVRTGHHCTQPLMQHFGIGGTVRVSFGLYNTMEETEALAAGIRRAQKLFGA